MLCMAASLCPCSPSSLLPSSGLIFGRFDYPEEIKYFYIKWYYNKYCQMLSFSVVPQLRVEFKQSTCGWWNECAHPLWATCASSLHPVLRCVLKGGQHQEQKSWPKHSSQSRTSLFLVLLGEPLRDLGAWRCDLHQSLSQLPPVGQRDEGMRPPWVKVPGEQGRATTTYKELLLALGVSFKDGIRQLCCLTRNKTTPFQMPVLGMPDGPLKQGSCVSGGCYRPGPS